MKTKHYLIAGLAFLLVLSYFTWLFIRDYALVKNFLPPIDSGIFSDWGSFIGGIMAFIAFIFAFATFLKQQNSIKLNDLENNFFKLISQLQFIVEQITIQLPTKGDVIITDDTEQTKYKIKDFQIDKYTGGGRNAIHILLLALLEKLRNVTEDKYEEAFNTYYNRFAHQLGHYFRFIYHIIKFIRGANLKEDEKQKYMDLLQAQLSTDEMGLIFYNAALGERSKKKISGERIFQKWLDDYKILENIDDDSIVKNADKHTFYPNTFKY